jgi:hypothetical protein
MLIVLKKSTGVLHLLHNGKLVVLHAQTMDTKRIPVYEADDASFTNLVTAYGAVVGT